MKKDSLIFVAILILAALFVLGQLLPKVTEVLKKASTVEKSKVTLAARGSL